MKNGERRTIVGSFLIVSSLMLTALPASALPSGVYSLYDEGWSAWASPNGVVSRTAALSFDSECAETSGVGPDGDNEFGFSFAVDASDCIVPVENLLGRPVALFTWQYFDELGDVVEFPCLDVGGTARTLGAFEGAIEFGVAVGAEGTSRTRDELTNVDLVTLVLLLPGLTYTGTESVPGDEVGVQNGVNNGIFDIEISIAPCTGDFDGPDIEHYRRRAEQATALPDTK